MYSVSENTHIESIVRGDSSGLDRHVGRNELDSNVRGVLVLGVRIFIRLYQYWISPWVGSCCRFEPTCSHFADQAIQRHGLFKGILLATGRILKCHPFHPGGLDPVP